MNEPMYVKIGLSDNNEHDKTLFCIRTYVDGHPVSKKLEKDFDVAMKLAINIVKDDMNKIVVNVRATRRAKQIVLQEIRNRREAEERKTAPRSIVGGE